VTMTPLNKAVFLDRDGTIIKEVSYLSRLEDIRLMEGAADGISLLNRAGFKVIVVTNQSGIARGFFDRAFVEETHREIGRMLAQKGAHIDAWYYCPHHPDEGEPPYRRNCSCRKPETGMIDKATKELSIDTKGSFMVGDSLRDLETGWRAGLKSILVLTGYGRGTLDKMTEEAKGRTALIAQNLGEACQWIVDKCQGNLPDY